MSGSGFTTVEYTDSMESVIACAMSLQAYVDELGAVSPVNVAISEIIGEMVCPCDDIPITCTRVDSTHLRVDFDEPVLVIPPLTQVGSYTLSPSLVVLSVSLGPTTPGVPYNTVEYVTLTTRELSPVVYTVRVFGLEGA